MRTFKDIKTFEEKLKLSLCWEDYFRIGNLKYKLFEYGDLPDSEYVYFYNKSSKTMLYIKYDCPASKFEKGKRIVTKTYKFISLEVINNPHLWRTDTL